MGKPTSKTLEYMVYNEMRDWVEYKYNIKTRDYAGKFACVPGQENTPHPYQDFWHFMLECNDSISRGSMLPVNFEDLKEMATEGWQKDICDFFIKEFGEDHPKVLFDW